MLLRILGDLHLESGPLQLLRAPADAVVLAGDIHEGIHAISRMEMDFKGTPVVYVAGNHEFYDASIYAVQTMLAWESQGGNVHFLENTSVMLGGVRFLGCTLWTDFALGNRKQADMKDAAEKFNEYTRIKGKKGDFTPQESLAMHRASLEWLKKEIPLYDPRKTVIVTHHAPSARSIGEWNRGKPYNSFFASALDKFVEESGVALWVHGHTHVCADYKIGATRVLSNPRGYCGTPIGGFNPGLVVEV